MYGTITDEEIWRIRTNQELEELCKPSDSVADIKK
jgi:hypothetical protein